MTDKMNSKQYRKMAGGARRPKYGNTKVFTDEGKFDSKREYDRWCDLKLLRDQGAIESLERQVKFVFRLWGVRIASYTADFTYVENGTYVVEDSKGQPNDRWPMKKKLMLAFYGINVKEV
jgi:hypothetical protein